MSTLNVDALVGNTSANAITVRGEGSATTSLQQGLSKVWANLNGSTFGLRDSFNVTSATDNSAGDHTITIANDMGNGNYSVTTNAGDKNFSSLGHVGINGASAPAAGSIRLGTTGSDGSNVDHPFVMIQIAGDLA
tara:strand:+ start:724 stop:1128 length:405 start_codon:yes stop_codon:yes gene_type:complete